ncbi:cereblon family protein [Pseudodesulfovibrio portus]|nr:cereblon family protein [Pseudodesulfovibrio portus]
MSAMCKHRLRALRNGQDTNKPATTGRVDTGKQPDLDEGGHGSVLVCRFCRSRITRRDLAMEINGSHRHVFFNPHGQVFELGCFASAKNVLPTGPRTDEFTWFPGFVWQAVACTGCLAQLGWRYTGEGGGFFGLILTALAEEPTGKP